MSCITNSEDEMVVFKGNVAFYASAIILNVAKYSLQFYPPLSHCSAIAIFKSPDLNS